MYNLLDHVQSAGQPWQELSPGRACALLWTRSCGLPNGQTLLSRLFCRFASFGCMRVPLTGLSWREKPSSQVAETLSLGGACTRVAGPGCSSSLQDCGKRSADLRGGSELGAGTQRPGLGKAWRHCRVPACEQSACISTCSCCWRFFGQAAWRQVLATA